MELKDADRPEQIGADHQPARPPRGKDHQRQRDPAAAGGHARNEERRVGERQEGAAKAGLEDEFRPHFFGGVATVVAKLFTQVSPDFALFGQKDYQQLRVVTQMAKDLDLPVKVIGVPTVREPDGLALSSRNVYLSATERAAAPMLYRVLKGCAGRIKSGEKIDRVLNVGRIEFDLAGFALDYLEARHAITLAPITSPKDGPIRLLAAARIGKTRLIDNVAV